MKKVVINGDFGGFGLSCEALVLLHMMDFPMKGSPCGESGFKESEFVLEGPDGYRAHPHFGAILKDGLVYYHGDVKDNYALRSHPALVKVVETLGKRADGNSSDLVVKEMDDGMYTIKTYDGRETLEELKPYGYVQGYAYEDVPLPTAFQLTNMEVLKCGTESSAPSLS